MNGIKQAEAALDVTSGDGSALLSFLLQLLRHLYNPPTEPSSSDPPREDTSPPGGVGSIPPSRPGSTEAQGGRGRAGKDRWVVLPSEGDLSRVPT